MEPNRTARRLYDRSMLEPSQPDDVLSEAAANPRTEDRRSRSRGCRRSGSSSCFRGSSRTPSTRARRRAGRCCRRIPPSSAGALLAAGFRDGWQAHWMAVDVGEPVESLRPGGVRVAVVDVPWRRPICRGTARAWAQRARLLDERRGRAALPDARVPARRGRADLVAL